MVCENQRVQDFSRFSRQLVLPGFGQAAQRALTDARVLVIGAGGLGSAVIPALAAAGVGTIGIIDFDTVEPANLHRQLIHTVADIGRLKVDSAADTVAALNPDTVVHAFAERLGTDNALDLFSRFDLVVDGSDNFPTRYLAGDAAELTGIPLVWGAVSQFGGQLSVSVPDGPGYRDLFPVPPAPDSVPSCEVGGVLPTVCATIGALMATEVIKLITGIGTPLAGRVITLDALTGSVRELAFRADPERARIAALIDYDAFCGVRAGAPVTAAPVTPTSVTPASVTAPELAVELASGGVVLIDVREPWEAELAAIPGARLIPLGRFGLAARDLDLGARIVVHCHSDVRSRQALAQLEQLGADRARYLVGGIDAWSRLVDPSVARY